MNHQHTWYQCNLQLSESENQSRLYFLCISRYFTENHTKKHMNNSSSDHKEDCYDNEESKSTQQNTLTCDAFSWAFLNISRSLSVTPGGRTGRGIFSMLPGLRSTTGEETNPSAPHACTYLVTHRLCFTLLLKSKCYWHSHLSKHLCSMYVYQSATWLHNKDWSNSHELWTWFAN